VGPDNLTLDEVQIHHGSNFERETYWLIVMYLCMTICTCTDCTAVVHRVVLCMEVRQGHGWSRPTRRVNKTAKGKETEGMCKQFK